MFVLTTVVFGTFASIILKRGFENEDCSDDLLLNIIIGDIL